MVMRGLRLRSAMPLNNSFVWSSGTRALGIPLECTGVRFLCFEVHPEAKGVDAARRYWTPPRL